MGIDYSLTPQPKKAKYELYGNSIDLGLNQNKFDPNLYNIHNTDDANFIKPDGPLASNSVVLGAGAGLEGGTRLTGADRTATAGLVDGYVKDQGYRDKATDAYTPIYNDKVTALQNANRTKTAALEGQKAGVNVNYDLSLQNADRNNVASKNNYSNTLLGRGLGRSSIVATGLGDMDVSNNRNKSNIGMTRDATLSGIDGQVAAEKMNYADALANLEANKSAEINNLYDKYENRGYARDQQDISNKRADAAIDYSKALEDKKWNYKVGQDTQNFKYQLDTDAQKQSNFELSMANDNLYKDKSLAASAANAAASRAASAASKSSKGPTASEIARQDKQNAKNSTSQAMDYLNLLASGKAKDDNGNYLPRATALEIDDWINHNSGDLMRDNADVKYLGKWAKDTFKWGRSGDNSDWGGLDD